MKQISSKMGYAPSLSLGISKLKAADRIARAEAKAKPLADLKSRNAYRAAIGLPIIK